MGRTAKNRDLSIVIPAFNEEHGIGVTLAGVIESFPGAEVIVVDDCSQDRTAEIVRGYPGVSLVRHAFNRGQGGALKTGMRKASRRWVAWFDADNEHRTEDLTRLYARALQGDVVAVIGQRTNASASLIRGLGKWLIRLIGRSMNVNAGRDANCGLRLFRRDIVLAYAPLIPDRFSASLVTTLIMLERRYPIAFEPVETNPRIGTSTVRLRDGFDAILALIRAVLLFAPLRIFLPFGLWLVALGLTYSVYIALHAGLGVPVGGILVFLSGVLAIMLGLVADQISQMRLSQLSEAILHHVLFED